MKILVKTIMTDQITVAGLDHKFSQVMEFFEKSGVRHLPVTDGGKVIGIISARDVMKDLYQQLSKGEAVTLKQMDETFKVKDIMTPVPKTIPPDTEIEDAMAILMNAGFHALPVVENDELKGIVTYHDLLGAYFKEKRPPVHYTSGAPGFAV